MQITDMKNKLTEYLVFCIQEQQAIQHHDMNTAAQCREKLQALKQVVETLPTVEQAVIKNRYFVNHLPLRRWKEVSIIIYGSASDAHLRATYRAHNRALKKLCTQLHNN